MFSASEEHQCLPSGTDAFKVIIIDAESSGVHWYMVMTIFLHFMNVQHATMKPSETISATLYYNHEDIQQTFLCATFFIPI